MLPSAAPYSRLLALFRCLALAAFLAPVLSAQDVENEWKDLVSQGQHLVASNDFPHAEQVYQRALHAAERFGKDDWRVGNTLESLGQVLSSERKYADAETALRGAAAIFEKAYGAASMELANVNLDLAYLMLDSGHPSDAIILGRKTLSVFERELGGTDLQTGGVLCLLGNSLRTMRNYTDAEPLLHRCAGIREASSGIDSSDLADALHSLALTYVAEKKYKLAESNFKLVEKIRESRLGLMNPLVAQTLEDHAALLKLMGREKDAERLLVLSSAIRRSEKKNIVRYPENNR